MFYLLFQRLWLHATSEFDILKPSSGKNSIAEYELSCLIVPYIGLFASSKIVTVFFTVLLVDSTQLIELFLSTGEGAH